MDPLILARWQFGITTLYHFLFVPLSIGLSILVAVMQSLWMRSRDDDYRRMTRFYGQLLLINFAMGVATGIVQEFQFGMNWSSYSRFVGDVFGAPLAMEGLLAFFLESTFLGLWAFGWGRLPEGVHLACIWIVALARASSRRIARSDRRRGAPPQYRSLSWTAASDSCHRRVARALFASRAPNGRIANEFRGRRFA